MTVGVLIAVHVATGAYWWATGEDTAFTAFLGDRDVRFRVAVGGQYRPLVEDGEGWRLWTSVLLHGDALHLLVNAIAVSALGRILEPVIGGLRWLAWFAIGGLAGSATSQALQVSQSDGASGAAFALLGAALVLGWRHRSEWPPEDWRLLGPVLGGFTILNVVLSFALPFVDAAGHLGGLAMGLLLGAAASLERGEGWQRHGRPRDLLLVVGFVAVCAYGAWSCFT